MSTVLVTGGTGFVGSNLVRRLIATGDDVHLLVRPSARLWRLEGVLRDVHMHTCELGDTSAVRGLMQEVRPERVFHLAVYGAYSFERDFRQMVQTNLLGLSNLLEAAVEAGVDMLINTGSSSEYGAREHAPDEEDPVLPDTPYAITKAAATALCVATARRTGLYVPTLRLYSVYGPYEDPRRLIPTLVRHGVAGEWPPLAAPWIAHDFIHVDDVVDAYLAVTNSQNKHARSPIYNVGTGRQTTLGELTDLARTLFKIQPEPSWGTYSPRDWDRTNWRANPERLRRELGWSHRIDLSDGLLRLAETTTA